MKIFAIIGAATILNVFAATNDLVSFGDVKVDSRARTVSFPAKVNLRSGPIEYLVVHETGKIHESIFKTSVSPQQIHLAALLLSKGGTNSPAAKPQFEPPSIQVIWKVDGREKASAAEQLILDKKKGRALGTTKWAYRGSRLIDGVFLAEREGSIIAVMEDRAALIDQATPDASDDENWEPLTEAIPPIGADVKIVIRLEPPKE